MNSKIILGVSNKGTIQVLNDEGEFIQPSDGNMQKIAGVTLSLQRVRGMVVTGKLV